MTRRMRCLLVCGLLIGCGAPARPVEAPPAPRAEEPVAAKGEEVEVEVEIPADDGDAKAMVREHRRMRRYEEAETIARALVERTGDEESYRMLAEIYVQSRRDAEALEVMSAYAERFGDAAAHAFLAETQVELQLVDDAIGSYERAVAMDPSVARWRLGLAQLYLQVGRLDDAFEMYLQLLGDSDEEVILKAGREALLLAEYLGRAPELRAALAAHDSAAHAGLLEVLDEHVPPGE